MPAGHDAEVTPRGVRDGDPAVLQALVARRGPAVVAFCAAVCEPAGAPRAAAEAFARFRAAVAAAPDASTLVPDDLLLGATRHAAASFARSGRPAGAAARPRPRPDAVCPDVPALLAARAGGSLVEADRRRLSRHLTRCAPCRELEAAFAQAEEAFHAPPDAPLPAATRKRIVAAMRAAAPVGPGAAAATTAPAQPGDQPAAHGAFSMPEPQPEPGPESGPGADEQPADGGGPATAQRTAGGEPAAASATAPIAAPPAGETAAARPRAAAPARRRARPLRGRPVLALGAARRDGVAGIVGAMAVAGVF